MERHTGADDGDTGADAPLVARRSHDDCAPFCAALRRPPSLMNGECAAPSLPPPAMHMMVAMHTSLLMATLVILVEMVAMYNHMSLLPKVAMHMVLFAMHTVMIGVDDVHFL